MFDTSGFAVRGVDLLVSDTLAVSDTGFLPRQSSRPLPSRANRIRLNSYSDHPIPLIRAFLSRSSFVI